MFSFVGIQPNEVTVYSADTGKEVIVIGRNKNWPIHLAAVNNKKKLVAISCSYVDGNYFTDHIAIKIFDLNSGKLIKRINKNRWYLDS